VFDRDPATPRKGHTHAPPPNFWPMSIVAKRLDRSRCHLVRSCPLKGTQPSQFSVHVYCGQTAGWMNTPLGTEVDIGPDYIVLDGVPALRERGTTTPFFHVYCGHGRPSQLLLSSCYSHSVVTLAVDCFVWGWGARASWAL